MHMQALGLLPNYLTRSDSDDPCSVLSTRTLPRSIATSSDGLPALQWLFYQLESNPVLDETLAAQNCCEETGVSPAIFASCLVDMERRGFIERVHGWVSLLSFDVDSCKLHSSHAQPASLLAKHMRIRGDQSVIPSCFERIVVLTPDISANEYGCACTPWTSSFTSTVAMSTHQMEHDFLSILHSLSNSNPKVLSQPMDDLFICNVLTRGGGSVAELARVSVSSKHKITECPPAAVCSGGELCEICSSQGGEFPVKLPYGHIYQCCSLCLDNKPCILLQCGHSFCLEDVKAIILTAMRDAETPAAAIGGREAGGQSLFELGCPDCKIRISFSFICAIAPDLTTKLRQRLFSTLLASISGGSSPFARCTCGESVFIGTSHECEVLCGSCGLVTTVGDCKRGISTGSMCPHPGVTSDAAFQW